MDFCAVWCVHLLEDEGDGGDTRRRVDCMVEHVPELRALAGAACVLAVGIVARVVAREEDARPAPRVALHRQHAQRAEDAAEERDVVRMEPGWPEHARHLVVHRAEHAVVQHAGGGRPRRGRLLRLLCLLRFVAHCCERLDGAERAGRCRKPANRDVIFSLVANQLQ